MAHTLANSNLGISDQALSVLAMLAAREPERVATYNEDHREYNIEIRTFAWYNGRERGVCLVVRPTLTYKTALVITFGECRSSDSIFVDSWETEDFFLNPPTVADFPDSAYEARETVPYGRIDLAVTKIEDKIIAYTRTVDEPAAELDVTVHGHEVTIEVETRGARILPDLGEETPSRRRGRRLAS